MGNVNLYIPPLIKAQLLVYTEAAKGEIGGLGRIAITDDNELLVTEVFLIEQTAHAAECDLDAEGIAKLYQELIDTNKSVDDIMFWWHSHGDMGVHFSGTDKSTIAEWPGDWLVALVVNKRAQTVAELHSWVPIHLVATLDVKDVVYHPHKEALVKEVAEKVRDPKTVPLEKEPWYAQYRGYQKPRVPVGQMQVQQKQLPAPIEGTPLNGEPLTLLEQLYPEIKDKGINELTEEEWSTLDTILESLKPEDQKQLFHELDDNEEDMYDLEFSGLEGYYGPWNRRSQYCR